MADIFFSYAREDQAAVSQIISSLEAEGFTVWWDRVLVPGETFDRRTLEAIAEAPCMVVAWSQAALKSNYVPDEASIGRDRNILIPISLDGTKPPLGFGAIHAVDISEGSRRKRLQELIAGVRRVQNGSPMNQLPVMIASSSTHESFLSKVAKNFLDGSKGRDVPIEEFSSLFRMEAHTGIFGIVFTIVWFSAALISLPALRSDTTFILSGAVICVVFLLPLFGSLLLSGSYSEERSDRPTDKMARDRRNRKVRAWLTLMSTGYVLVCVGLIWLTGGAYSPFIPFYVMVFTLTLSRNKVSYPGPGWLILIGFLVAIAIASFGSYIVPSPIKEALAELQDKPFYYSVAAGFIGASLVVPTISGWLFERRERARELERLESASRGDAS